MKKLFKKEEEILIQSNSIPLLLAMIEEFRKADYLINDEWNKNYRFSLSQKKYINTDFEQGIMFFNHDCGVPTTRQYTLPKDWDIVLELINKPEVKAPKIPKYVRAVNAADKQFTIGKIYEVYLEYSSSSHISVIADDKGKPNGWSMVNFKPSTKKAFEEQNKPKSKFKVGNKVFTLHPDYVDAAQLKTISKIEGTEIYTGVTHGWWEEEHTVLADEEGMLQLLNYLYPVGTRMKCAKNGEYGVSICTVKEEGGNYYVEYDDNYRNQYVYLPYSDTFAEKVSPITTMPFGERMFEVDIEHKIVTIPDYGNVNAEQIKEIIEWYKESPKIKGYKLEVTNVNFGCHEGNMEQIFNIYDLIKD